MKSKKKNPLPAILALLLTAALVAGAIVLIAGRRHDPGDTPGETDEPLFTSEAVRGVFVPTVYNLTFPSSPDRSADELRREIDEIVSVCAECGIDHIYFQVRPECDALYKSDIFPVSHYLSTDGTLPLDVLEYLVAAAHSEQIAVCAWINPLRVSVGNATVESLPDNSPAKGDFSEYVVSYGGKLYFDPAYPEVRRLVCDGVAEIVENYGVDGIIFDDYFYPYQVWEKDGEGRDVLAVFDDEDSYAAYAEDGVSLADFRRENVNALVRSVYETVKGIDRKCRFGVACAGIWQNDDGENGGSATRGMQSYEDVFCDTLAWIEGGYVDFIAPQIYWDIDSSVAPYKEIAAWWNEKVDGHDVDLYISHAAYRYADGDFEPGEMTEQISFAKGLDNYKGSIFYSYAALRDDLAGIRGELKEIYKD